MPPAEKQLILPENPRIVLTGFMGAGKSTIGRMLATRLGWRFYDTDNMIIKGFKGLPVSQIFERHGEQAFRDAELQVLKALGTKTHAVISTGGGALGSDEPLQVALNYGTVVYLFAPVEVLYERVIYSLKDRPILNEENTEGVFRNKFAEREVFYNQAHLKITSAKRDRNEVVIELMDALMRVDAEQKENQTNTISNDAEPTL